jgi:hypothetical protein
MSLFAKAESRYKGTHIYLEIERLESISKTFKSLLSYLISKWVKQNLGN